MIHDATVEVTCDGNCGAFEEIWLPYVFSSRSENSGHYDSRDATIERLLEKRRWFTKGGKQYCPDCRESAERALNEAEPQHYGRETPTTHYLPDQAEILRLADKLSGGILTLALDSQGTMARHFPATVDCARVYRRARGLEEASDD